MGGFRLVDEDGNPLYPLDREQIVTLIGQKGQDHLVPPSVEDINDRSKGDGFSKIIVLGQTAWFVMQCIARAVQHIHVTDMEIVTLAYTLVIVGMYVFWWSKPLHASQPVGVVAVAGVVEAAGTSTANAENRSISLFKWLKKWIDTFTGKFNLPHHDYQFR